IVGGSTSGVPIGALASAEIYNPVAGTFTLTTGSLGTGRFEPTATLLPNGSVLIAGGQNSTGTLLTSTEIYTPGTQSFTAGPGPLNVARAGHTATLLPSGKILMAGGSGSNSAELYDPTTGLSASTGSMSVNR